MVVKTRARLHKTKPSEFVPGFFTNMSSDEPAKAHNAEPKPEPMPLEGGIASDIAHIASLLGPDDFEPPVAVSPRPVGIREDVKVLAMELFEAAKAETVRPH